MSGVAINVTRQPKYNSCGEPQDIDARVIIYEIRYIHDKVLSIKISHEVVIIFVS